MDRPNLHANLVDRGDIGKFLPGRGDVDMTGSTGTPSFCPMNRATGSATPPSTVISIMPTRSFPLGAISDAGVVCASAAPDMTATNAIERRIRPMCLSPGMTRITTFPIRDNDANYFFHNCRTFGAE